MAVHVDLENERLRRSGGKLAASVAEIRKCINCEFADPVGDWRTMRSVDCHNSSSPRFTPERDFVCGHFMLSTTINDRGFG